jgi:hypothetical protein
LLVRPLAWPSTQSPADPISMRSGCAANRVGRPDGLRENRSCPTNTAELTRVRRRGSCRSRAPPDPASEPPRLRRVGCGCDPAARPDSADPLEVHGKGSHVKIHMLCLALVAASIHTRRTETWAHSSAATPGSARPLARVLGTSARRLSDIPRTFLQAFLKGA